MEQLKETGATPIEQGAFVAFESHVAQECTRDIGRKVLRTVAAFGIVAGGMAIAGTAGGGEAKALTSNPTCETVNLGDGEVVTGCIAGTSDGLTMTWKGYSNTGAWRYGVSQFVQFADMNSNRYNAGTDCVTPDSSFNYGLSNQGEYLGTFSINEGGSDHMVTFDLIAGGTGVQGPHDTSTCGNFQSPPSSNTCDKSLKSGVVGMATTYDGNGYWIAKNDGEIAACGDATDLGNGLPNTTAITASPDGKGYWLATANGQVEAFGSAVYHGGIPTNVHLNKPVVAMTADPATGGYWLLGGDGGVFSYDAPFYGSTGNIHLNQPAVGMASTTSGGGYYFVATDGGIFAYGNASFYGSTGGVRLNKPVVGMAIDEATGGYWMDASDGGIFSFRAPFYGSTGNITLAQPCVGMAAMPDGSGYRFVATDGGIFDFRAPFEGSAT